MKSYGDKWNLSKLNVAIEGRKSSLQWKRLHEFHFTGYHNSTTSINVSHKTDLGDFFQPGDSIRVSFTLVSGTTFQVNGLALCHSAQPFDAVV